ncbi:hypothetical protein GYMLUDRAFT_45179 [Collybiopsis luxurians FD-317 M1]|uniref:Uncharacterized protein n=1 Tax=Collybiopsis luxurians FD-317 M1 TaxID=944289 RepID=A0A0D0CJK3_9AGAR|nr:hypothetical protein GYMLUDRAFT_45179 [Collybiopsis luxurians FD-317 M1]
MSMKRPHHPILVPSNQISYGSHADGLENEGNRLIKRQKTLHGSQQASVSSTSENDDSYAAKPRSSHPNLPTSSGILTKGSTNLPDGVGISWLKKKNASRFFSMALPSRTGVNVSLAESKTLPIKEMYFGRKRLRGGFFIDFNPGSSDFLIRGPEGYRQGVIFAQSVKSMHFGDGHVQEPCLRLVSKPLPPGRRHTGIGTEWGNDFVPGEPGKGEVTFKFDKQAPEWSNEAYAAFQRHCKDRVEAYSEAVGEAAQKEMWNAAIESSSNANGELLEGQTDEMQMEMEYVEPLEPVRNQDEDERAGVPEMTCTEAQEEEEKLEDFSSVALITSPVVSSDLTILPSSPATSSGSTSAPLQDACSSEAASSTTPTISAETEVAAMVMYSEPECPKHDAVDHRDLSTEPRQVPVSAVTSPSDGCEEKEARTETELTLTPAPAPEPESPEHHEVPAFVPSPPDGCAEKEARTETDSNSTETELTLMPTPAPESESPEPALFSPKSCSSGSECCQQVWYPAVASYAHLMESVIRHARQQVRQTQVGESIGDEDDALLRMNMSLRFRLSHLISVA